MKYLRHIFDYLPCILNYLRELFYRAKKIFFSHKAVFVYIQPTSKYIIYTFPTNNADSEKSLKQKAKTIFSAKKLTHRTYNHSYITFFTFKKAFCITFSENLFGRRVFNLPLHGIHTITIQNNEVL